MRGQEGPKSSVQCQETCKGNEQTFRVSWYNQSEKSASSQGQTRLGWSASSSWKILTICMRRWYRDGEKWNPRDGNRMASLVKGSEATGDLTWKTKMIGHAWLDRIRIIIQTHTIYLLKWNPHLITITCWSFKYTPHLSMTGRKVIKLRLDEPSDLLREACLQL